MEKPAPPPTRRYPLSFDSEALITTDPRAISIARGEHSPTLRPYKPLEYKKS